jgi:hypothetical protein
MQRAECRALWTEEAAAEGIRFVATHADDSISLDLQRDTTGRLAERAASMGETGGGGGHGGDASHGF